MMPKYSGN